MVSLKLFLFVLALVLLLLAALKVPEPRWLSYGWSGVFLLALSQAAWR
jgi:hypothetical protein